MKPFSFSLQVLLVTSIAQNPKPLVQADWWWQAPGLAAGVRGPCEESRVSGREQSRSSRASENRSRGSWRTHLGARAARVGPSGCVRPGSGSSAGGASGSAQSGSRPLATRGSEARPAPPDVTSDRSQDGGERAAGAGAGGAVAAVRRRLSRRSEARGAAQPGKKQPGRVASGTAAGSAPDSSLCPRGARRRRRRERHAGDPGAQGQAGRRARLRGLSAWALAAPPAMRRGPRAAGVRPSRAEHPGPALGPGAGSCVRFVAAG